MNDKQVLLTKIVEAVVDCCASELSDGRKNITLADVLSKSHAENVVQTRQIAAMQISHAGYTATTIAQLLGCTTSSVRKMIADGYNRLQMSSAFNFAYSEATIRCAAIIAQLISK